MIWTFQVDQNASHCCRCLCVLSAWVEAADMTKQQRASTIVVLSLVLRAYVWCRCLASVEYSAQQVGFCIYSKMNGIDKGQKTSRQSFKQYGTIDISACNSWRTSEHPIILKKHIYRKHLNAGAIIMRNIGVYTQRTAWAHWYGCKWNNLSIWLSGILSK